MNKIVNYFYIAGFMFLSFDIYQMIIDFNPWEIFKDLIFMLVIVYMVFIYPKRKLKLTEDLFIILFVYFFVYGIKSFMESYWFGLAVSVVYVVGIVAYKLYRKKHKYSFYLKK